MNKKVHTAGRYVETYKKAPLTHLGLQLTNTPFQLSAHTNPKRKSPITDQRHKQFLLYLHACYCSVTKNTSKHQQNQSTSKNPRRRKQTVGQQEEELDKKAQQPPHQQAGRTTRSEETTDKR
jgi:hypothetical protein